VRVLKTNDVVRANFSYMYGSLTFRSYSFDRFVPVSKCMLHVTIMVGRSDFAARKSGRQSVVTHAYYVELDQ